MNPYLFSLAWARWRRRSLVLWLNVLGVAVGVGGWLSIQALNVAAVDSFGRGVAAVSEKADYQVRSKSGILTDEDYRTIAFLSGVEAATPIIENWVRQGSAEGRLLRFVGIDGFTLAPFVESEERLLGDEPLADRFYWGTNSVVLVGMDGESLIHQDQPPFKVVYGASDLELDIIRTIPRSESRSSRQALILADIAVVQALLGRSNQLDRIDLIVSEQFRPSAELAEKYLFETPKAHTKRLDRMLDAFWLNLNCLSMMALCVGLLLVYGTMSAEVVRQTYSLGILKAVGAKAQDCFYLILFQAVWIGLVGGILGCFLGYVFGSLGAPGLGGVISNHYSKVELTETKVPLWLCGLGVLVSLGVSCLGAVMPAIEVRRWEIRLLLKAGATEPERATGVLSRRWLLTVLALGLLAIGFSLTAVYGGNPLFGIGAAFMVFIVACLLGPLAVWCLSKGLSRGQSRLGAMWPIVWRSLMDGLIRTRASVAGLAAAFALMVSVSVMVHSFRMSLVEWINHSLQADLYISGVEVSETMISEEGRERIRALEGVLEVDGYQEARVFLGEDDVSLAANDLLFKRLSEDRNLIKGDFVRIEAELDRLANHPESGVIPVVVTEAFHRKRGVGVEDVLQIQSRQGVVKLKVLGVVRDYTSEQGRIFLRRKDLRFYWRVEGLKAMSVYWDGSRPFEEVTASVEKALIALGDFQVRSNRQLRSEVLTIFDDTFRITAWLRLVAVAVAILGLGLGASAWMLHRRRVVASLYSLGATRFQSCSTLLGVAGLTGFAGGIAGVVGGVLLSWVLVYVINPAFFGWTIDWYWKNQFFFEGPLLGLAVGLIAGFLPAWRVGSRSMANELRAE